MVMSKVSNVFMFVIVALLFEIIDDVDEEEKNEDDDWKNEGFLIFFWWFLLSIFISFFKCYSQTFGNIILATSSIIFWLL